jgi:hypothetical protein
VPQVDNFQTGSFVCGRSECTSIFDYSSDDVVLVTRWYPSQLPGWPAPYISAGPTTPPILYVTELLFLKGNNG